MGRTLQRVLIAFATIVGVPTVGLATYDALVVRPRLDAVHAMLREADPQDRHPSHQVEALIEAVRGAPENHATRVVLFRVMPPGPQGDWHARQALWRILLPMHMEREDLFALYASQSWNGVDKGLNKLAQRRYGKPLDALSSVEAANVVAITHSPEYYTRNPERLELRVQFLLKRAAL